MTKQLIITSVVALGVLLSANSPAQAQSLDERLAACKSIENALQRLVCFDEVAANVKGSAVASNPVAGTPASERAQSVAGKKDRPATSQRDNFGFEHIPDEEAEKAKPDRLAIKIANHSVNRVGVLTIETTDGQVWEQTSAERFNIDESADYYLERGLFGSYFFLGRTDGNRRTRVKRVK
jgi:hypothetical protein